MLLTVELLSLCMHVLDNSTGKCHFLIMCYKDMFGLI